MRKEFYYTVFLPAALIVTHKRQWFFDLRHKFMLHPAVAAMMAQHGYKPIDWQRLLLEWPHVSETDPTRLAYTRDERAGQADRQTITTVGKYLTRHFDAPDHIIRDVQALHTPNPDGFQLLHKLDEMIDAVKSGPHSCMCWADSPGVYCSDGVHRHPYAVYDPAYGWHMAVRTEGSAIVGRALCNSDDDGQKYFVRSYKHNPGGYSPSDEALEAWLKSQGYTREGQWHDGAKLAYYETDAEFLAPYIDGVTKNVDVCGSGSSRWLEITGSGEYDCTNTEGAATNCGSECECCGSRVRESDMHWVGRGDETHVCESCFENDYVLAYGRRGNQYYILRADVIYIDSQDSCYDEDYLSDNNIVELHNGDYEHIDNAVHIESEDEWYHNEDDDICYDDYNERYELCNNCVRTKDMGYVHQDDAWQCEASDNWYSDNVDYVYIDGSHYHPDQAPEQETNEQE